MNKKELMALLTILFLIIFFQSYSQNSLPKIPIKTIDGTPESSSSFENGDYPYLICFWKSCCNSSIKFMDALNEIYPDLIEDHNIKVFAIAIDDSRTLESVRPLVDGNAWEFEFFLDPNEDFARAMNISLTPHCIVYDGDNNMLWQKSVCMEGDEYVIEVELSKINN